MDKFGTTDGATQSEANVSIAPRNLPDPTTTFHRILGVLLQRFGLDITDAAAEALRVASSGPPYIYKDADITDAIVHANQETESEALSKPSVEAEQSQASDPMDIESTPQTPTETSAAPAASPSAEAVVVAPPVKILDYVRLESLVQTAQTSGEFKEIRGYVYDVFTQSDSLNNSFLREDGTKKVDLDSVNKAYELLLSVGNDSVINSLRYALETLLPKLKYKDFRGSSSLDLHQLLIVLEHPLLFDPDYYKNILTTTVNVIYTLPKESKQVLAEYWSESEDRYIRLLALLQQYVTIRMSLSHPIAGSSTMGDILCAVSVMEILHEINNEKHYVTYSEFYNDAVNQELDVIDDYRIWKTRGLTHGEPPASRDGLRPEQLSFCDFFFILDAAMKAKLLQLDAKIQMRQEFQQAMIRTILLGRSNPYLLLRVHRENIIQDTLQQIHMMSSDDVNELKKPLKVQFVGEEGVDEGGVQKEFFQILIRQLLDPAYAMLIEDPDTRTLWFNSHSLESSMEFELIGILMGIAIYNGVILDVRFPLVLYKRLLGLKPTLEDLKAASPVLGKSLQQLLDYDGDVQSTFSLTFEIQQEVFGEVFTVQLKPNGSSINVTSENRQEYVELYVNYVLEKSVEKQYRAFHRGFHMVAGGGILQWFMPEELELLICGSPELDFEALEKVTHYEDGFTQESQCIRWFWDIVHSLPLEQKKKLLSFCTGSDRVPINGLSTLVFVISRNGPDSDRLPTAHTCFNHLLLPDYETQDKLRDRLLLAIHQAEGFGLM